MGPPTTPEIRRMTKVIRCVTRGRFDSHPQRVYLLGLFRRTPSRSDLDLDQIRCAND